ncbi:MAG TPA: BadF/BadG/BcrA/BcrD ATPase family protein [Candidatus Limnocylindrales bacterium]|nr:BadF/BadG/BcrA/BcrD ATPase family protein [Candidatus Limnocylindrales bacterium]
MSENVSKADATYFLGFDGGGTKTECVVAGADGKVLVRATSGPSNPLRAGYTKAWFNLSEAADVVLGRMKITSSHVRGICAGLGGASRPGVARRVTAFFERSFPNAEIEVTTDQEIAYEAAFGTGEGIILIAGTGSAAFGRDAQGRRARAGGRGPWFSDEGSGFDVGRRAVQAVVLADEGRGPATALSGRLLETLQMREWDTLTDAVTKNADDVFPRVFPLVAQLADEGDAVSREILATGAASLASLAAAVAEKLGGRDREVRIAKVGGENGRSRFFDSAIDTALTDLLPKWRPVKAEISPAEAAVRVAVRAKGNAASIG